MTLSRSSLAALLALTLAVPAVAVIARLYPLGDIVKDSDAIAVARVEKLDTRNEIVTVRRVDNLKATLPWTVARFKLTGGDDKNHHPVIAGRLEKGRSVVLFSKSKRFMLGFVEGNWFRLAPPADEKNGVWQFVHLEPFLRRTYRGTSAEMARTIKDVLSGKAQAPAPDPNAKPG